MADNTTLNTGTGGDVIATDDIAGIKYQRVKITIGADGTSDGDVASTNPLPIEGSVGITGTVAVTDNSGSLTVDGTVTANQPSSTAYRVILSDGTSDVPLDAAHADGEANTENHIDVGAKLLVFNGTSWDRQRGNATDGILVNLGTNNDVTVTGTVTANAGTGNFTVTQATAANLNATVTGTVAATQSGTWNINNVSGTVSLPTGAATSANQATEITSLQLLDDVVATDGSAALTKLYQVGGTDGTNAQILSTNASGHLNIADGGNSITVDGTVTANAGTGTFTVSGTVTANAGTGTMNVSVQNASIPVTDNGGSLTVDGTVAATQSGTWILGANSGVDIGDVSINNAAGASAVNIQDGGNSITVDGTVSVTDGLNIEGDVAHDSADSGNPVKIGFQAENAFPTAVATGDRANGISDVFGRQLVAHIDAGMQVWKGANYTTTQTGTDIWTPSSTKKICITYLAISSYATTGARVILWFGASGDTTYTAGTDQLVWAGSFAPSANSRPGAIISLPYGITAVTADHRLKITTDAAISLDLTIYGYEC
jgi:hypothetical protein